MIHGPRRLCPDRTRKNTKSRRPDQDQKNFEDHGQIRSGHKPDINRSINRLHVKIPENYFKILEEGKNVGKFSEKFRIFLRYFDILQSWEFQTFLPPSSDIFTYGSIFQHFFLEKIVQVVLLKLYRRALCFLLTMVSFLMNDLKPVR